MPHNTGDHDDRERQLRRLALQIVAQLPVSQAEANRVLEYASDCLNAFIFEHDRRPLRSPPDLRCVKSD